MQIVAVLYGLLAALLALAGSFADGDDVGARLLITLLHPLSAVGLLAAVFVKSLSRPVFVLIAALLLATVVADVHFALSIATGQIKGDWEIPAVLAVVPVVGFVFTLGMLKSNGLRAEEG